MILTMVILFFFIILWFYLANKYITTSFKVLLRKFTFLLVLALALALALALVLGLLIVYFSISVFKLVFSLVFFFSCLIFFSGKILLIKRVVFLVTYFFVLSFIYIFLSYFPNSFVVKAYSIGSIYDFFYWALSFLGVVSRSRKEVVLTPLLDWIGRVSVNSFLFLGLSLWFILFILTLYLYLSTKKKSGDSFLTLFTKNLFLSLSYDVLNLASTITSFLWVFFIFLFLIFLVLYPSSREVGLMGLLLKGYIAVLLKGSEGTWLLYCFYLMIISIVNFFIFLFFYIFYKFCKIGKEIGVKPILELEGKKERGCKNDCLSSKKGFSFDFLRIFIKDVIDVVVYKILFFYLFNLFFFIFYFSLSEKSYKIKIFLGGAIRLIGSEVYINKLEFILWFLLVLFSLIIFLCCLIKSFLELKNLTKYNSNSNTNSVDNRGGGGIAKFKNSPIVKLRKNLIKEVKKLDLLTIFDMLECRDSFVVFFGDRNIYGDVILAILLGFLNLCYGTGVSYIFWYILSNYHTKHLSGYGYEFYFESILLLKCLSIFRNIEEIVYRFFKYEEFYYLYGSEDRSYLFKNVVGDLPQDFLFSFTDQCYVVDREGFSRFSKEVLKDWKDDSFNFEKDVLGFPSFDNCRCCRVVLLPPKSSFLFENFYYVHRYGLGLSPNDLVNREVCEIRRLFFGVRDLYNFPKILESHITPTSSFNNTKHLLRIEGRLVLGREGSLVKIPISNLIDTSYFFRGNIQSEPDRSKRLETILTFHNSNSVSWLGVNDFEISDFRTCPREEVTTCDSTPISIYINFRVNFHNYFCPNLCSVDTPIVDRNRVSVLDKKFFNIFEGGEEFVRSFFYNFEKGEDVEFFKSDFEEKEIEGRGFNEKDSSIEKKIEGLIGYYYLKNRIPTNKVRKISNPSKTIKKFIYIRRAKKIESIIKGRRNSSSIYKRLNKDLNHIKLFLKKSFVCDTLKEVFGDKKEFSLCVYIRGEKYRKYCNCFHNLTTTLKGCLNTHSEYFLDSKNYSLTPILNSTVIKSLPGTTSFEKGSKFVEHLDSIEKDFWLVESKRYKPKCVSLSFFKNKKGKNNLGGKNKGFNIRNLKKSYFIRINPKIFQERRGSLF